MAIVLVTMVLTFITLVFGELAPKRVAMQRAETWALAAARPLNWLAVISGPAVWALGRTSDLVYDETDIDLQTVRREPDGSLIVPGGPSIGNRERRIAVDADFRESLKARIPTTECPANGVCTSIAAPAEAPTASLALRRAATPS